MVDQNFSSSGGGDNPSSSPDPQKLAKMVKHLEKKLKDSENLRKILEERYDNQSKLFEKTVEELDASKALIGEQFRKIESILKNINQGIVVVDGSLNLQDQMSRAVHEIVGHQLPPGAHLMKDILDATDLSADDKSKISTALMVSVGEDELNFEINCDNLPKEVRIPDRDRILELDWNPTLKDTIIENVIICIRDVTQMRALQESAKLNAENINYIIEIVENDPAEVFSFIKRCKTMLDENAKIMNATDKSIEEKIETMFRNAHTVKGSARIYNLSKVVNAVHELESAYQDVRSNKSPFDVSIFEQRLNECREAVAIYENILITKLHFEEESAAVSEEDRIFATIAKIQNAPPEARPVLIDELLKEYKLRSYHVISRVLAPVIRGIADIAMELHKPCPGVDISNGNFVIHGDIGNMIVDSFTHLIRNCLDHGLEPPQERLDLGKKREGLIKIWTQFSDDGSSGSILLEDDGRGLNLKKLKEVSGAPDSASDESLAEVIFQSGVSTASQVTSISGRGIGMNAVRETLRDVGGDIKIEFTGPKRSTGHRAFRFNLVLPAKYLFKIS